MNYILQKLYRNYMPNKAKINVFKLNSMRMQSKFGRRVVRQYWKVFSFFIYTYTACLDLNH